MQSLRNMLPISQKALVGTRDALLALEKHNFIYRHLDDGQRISIATDFSRYFLMDTGKILSLPEIRRELSAARRSENPLLHSVRYSAKFFTLHREEGTGFWDPNKAELPFSEIMASKRGECFEKALLAQILSNALGKQILTALGMIKYFNGRKWMSTIHAFNLYYKPEGLYLVDAAFPSRYDGKIVVYNGETLPYLCALPDRLVLSKKMFSKDMFAIGRGFPFQFCMKLSVPVDMGPAETKNDVRYYQFSFPRLVMPAGEWGALSKP